MASTSRKPAPKPRSTPEPASASLAEYRRKRDFARTPEPAGRPRRSRSKALAFVIQKHAASHLHFDLRLELDGVMKSWAVPKGPHADPSVKRLAMQVEDHPLEYNTFEGTIPKGEYGGGTVMLWDRGTYEVDELERGQDPQSALRAGLRAGKLGITFHGKRMRGSWALVRTGGGPKPKWLFFKHRDRCAGSGDEADLVAEHTTSVATGRTMNEIAVEQDRVWHSSGNGGEQAGPGPADTGEGDVVRPMLPKPVRKLPAEPRAYEAWHGGERTLAYVSPAACALLDEKGRDRAGRFPDIARALSSLARRVKHGFVLDGELVGSGAEARLFVFDLLLRGTEAQAALPWRERRDALEALFEGRRVADVKLAAAGSNAETMLRRAGREGWAGIFARREDAPYRPGKRTDDWLRLATPARYR